MRFAATIAVLIFVLVQQQPVAAAVLHAGNGQLYQTVTAAIRAAVDGDTILVHPGEYAEQNITITKRVVLKGLSYPVLDGGHKWEILSIKANCVVVEGLRLKNSGNSSLEDLAGIKLYQCRNVIIRNNVLENTFFGIYAQLSSNCIIKDNRITGSAKIEQQSGNGIHNWRCDSMQIIANSISGHRDGIYFEFVNNAVIWRNTSTKNLRYGLHFMFSHDNAYITNIFKNNGAGVAVMYSHGVKMYNNFFMDNYGDAAYGLLLKDISDSQIEGNHFTGNTSGIHMEGSSRLQLAKNEFRNNGWALQVQASCDDIMVRENNFIGNTFDVSTNGNLVLNTFDSNYWDKYEGYDLNRDKTGDVPYRPVSMYSMLVEQNPTVIMLFRSFIVTLMDKTEKVLPSLIPENLVDNTPLMKPLAL